MACHELIEGHLQALARSLPASVVEELRDGLIESYEDQLERLGDAEAAAHAAIADFGDADTVTAAFVRASPGRGIAVRLLLAGPVVGLSWAAALIAGHWWTWPISPPLRLAVGLVLGLAVLMLIVAVRERHHYRTVRLAALAGATGVAVLDTTLLATVVMLPAGPSVLLVPALAASVARVLLVVRAVPEMISDP
ncbi:hypothetical protein Pth03_28150 [Planotetraspora thailandica]|uniref:Uncharacterized protein n=1 Tax=Planotetraspora thailandica TaxID=487172 RepID=A0A8J3XW69_9ACTN|nr:hypothetical protein [Planotetraspora thailandica]GII54426.1 hypothetical protein Pth03_28150 [Planotetraspora thailandica]